MKEPRLEFSFHDDMKRICSTAKKELGYNPARFSQMLSEFGGVQTAKQLLNMTTYSEGFTRLALENRLDLSMEYHVALPKYASLFTEAEIQEAKKRLREYSF